MSWLLNLGAMTGRLDGGALFTQLSASGTPGRRQVFSAKDEAEIVIPPVVEVDDAFSGGFFDFPDRPKRKKRRTDDVEPAIAKAPEGLGVEVYHGKPVTPRLRKVLRLEPDTGLEAIGRERARKRKAQLAAEDDLMLMY